MAINEVRIAANSAIKNILLFILMKVANPTTLLLSQTLIKICQLDTEIGRPANRTPCGQSMKNVP